VILSIFSQMTGSAQLVLVSGAHDLNPGTAGLTIPIYVDNQGSSAVPVDTFNFVLQIGDGGPAAGGTTAPAITGVDLHTGTPFTGNYNPEVDQGSTPQVALVYISTQSGPTSIPADPLHSGHFLTQVATVTLSTVGFSTPGQTWNFNLLFNVPGYPSADSYFANAGIRPGQSIQVGSITVVPEPNVAAAVGGALLAFVALRRRGFPGV
jgi:hypothetical protein